MAWNKSYSNATGNNVFGTLHPPSRLILELREVNLSYFYDNLEKNIDANDLRNSILSRTGLHEITSNC